MDSALVDEFIERVAATDYFPVSLSRFEPGELLAHRFEVRRKLGAGGMGQVFAAYDLEQKYEVALKVLGSLTACSLQQLKREFRAACELVHPNLVRLHELFVDGGTAFFTMDLVEGDTLPELFSREPAARTLRLREILRQLTVALSALHGAGTLHRDLKPSNFLIARADGRVVLLDFGLAHPIGQRDRTPAGTPAYMAPEQRLGEPLTPAADWYCLGVILYEVLAGQLPKRMPTEELLRDAPADLRALCLQLLRLNPAERPNADQILGVLGSAPLERSSSIPSARQALVGRAGELARLNEAYRSAQGGTPAFVLVEGPSGIGKTALIEQFLDGLREQRVVRLSSRCRERESMSYKAADGLMDCLVSELNALPESEQAELIPSGIEQLTLLFPSLRALRGVASSSRAGFAHLDPSAVRDQAVATFVALIRNLARVRSVVFWIDDLQWSDAESAVLIGPLLTAAQAVPLLFVGSQRTRLGQDGALLTALADSGGLAELTRISLGPLEPESAEELAFRVLNGHAEDARAVAREIVRDAGGHPLFIAELAHGAAANGNGWLGVPPTLSDLVEARLALLDGDARTLLDLAALAGSPLTRSELRRSLNIERKAASAAFDAVKALRLVRTQGLHDEAAVDIQHDRIREIIVERLDESRCRQCHARIAATLQSSPDAVPERIAHHLRAAGEVERASEYFLLAAQRAFTALAFGHAATLYAQGLEYARGTAEELRSLQVRRAQALSHAGRGVAAADLYLSLSAEARGAERTDLQRRGAEQLLLAGDLERGIEVIQQVLRDMEMRPLRRGVGALMSIALGRARLRSRGMRHRVTEECALEPSDLARLDAAWTISLSMSLIDPICGADFQNEHLLLALRTGEPRRLLRALTLEASYAATPGRHAEQRSQALLALAEGLVHESTEPTALALLSLARGLVEYLLGRSAAALPHFREALQAFQERCAGAVWETMSAQRLVIACLFFLGRFRELGEIVPQLLSQSEGRATRYTTICFCSAYSTLAWLARDDAAEASRQLSFARAHCQEGPFLLAHFNLLVGESYLGFYTAEKNSIYRRIVQHWSAIERSQLLRVGVLRVQLWHLRGTAAAIAAAFAAQLGNVREAQRLREEALRCAERLSAEAIPRAAPLAKMIGAAISSSTGEIGRARACLRGAILGFQKQDMKLFAAAAMVRLGQLSASAAEAEPLVASGLKCFEDEGVMSPLRLADVFAPGIVTGENRRELEPLRVDGRRPSEATLHAAQRAS